MRSSFFDLVPHLAVVPSSCLLKSHCEVAGWPHNCNGLRSDRLLHHLRLCDHGPVPEPGIRIDAQLNPFGLGAEGSIIGLGGVDKAKASRHAHAHTDQARTSQREREQWKCSATTLVWTSALDELETWPIPFGTVAGEVADRRLCSVRHIPTHDPPDPSPVYQLLGNIFSVVSRQEGAQAGSRRAVTVLGRGVGAYTRPNAGLGCPVRYEPLA